MRGEALREEERKPLNAHLSEDEVRDAYDKMWVAECNLCNAMGYSYGGPETLDTIREKLVASRYN